MTSIGDIDTENKNRCVVDIDDKSGIYKKYVIKDDVLIGCILLGDTKDQRKIEKAIMSRQSYDEVVSEDR